jgi:DNA-binding transcriptional regulator YhcF (GntR family)
MKTAISPERTGIAGPKNTLARKTTSRLAEGGFCALPTLFLAHCAGLRGSDGKPLKSSEILLAIHILSFKWNEEHPFPAIETLAQRMGMNVRSIRKLLTSLEQAGLVTRLQVPRRANRYDLSQLFQAIERLADEQVAKLEAAKAEADATTKRLFAAWAGANSADSEPAQNAGPTARELAMTGGA